MTDKVSFFKFFLDAGKYSNTRVYPGSITDFFPAVVFIFQVDSFRIEYVNRGFTDYFGLTYNDIQENENVLTDLIFTEDLPRFKTSVDQLCLSEGLDAVTFTCRLTHKEGEEKDFRVHGSVLKRTAQGKADSILFIAQNIADEVRNKGALQTLENLFAESEEMLLFGSWTLSVHDDTMSWTPGLLKLLEYTPEELKMPLRMSFYLDHVVNEYKDPLVAMIDQALYLRTGFEYEYVIQTRSGNQKTFYTKGKIIKDASGNADKIIGITRDITSLRSFEKEQERHVRQLNKSNKELEEFAYVASHDLQEPLRKIAMFGERLRLKYGDSLDSEGELFLNRILASTASMKSLIDNLLEFSRANRSSDNFSLLDLRWLLEQVISDLELKIEETQCKITLKGVSPTLEAVPSEMKQLFTNLILNSIKFKKKNVPPEIEIAIRTLTRDEKKIYRLSPARNYFKTDVQDNGIGFEAEYSDKIFQIFQRLHGKTEYPGCGIGLAICKKIVENHSGIIFAHSVPNAGATFTVILPEKQF